MPKRKKTELYTSRRKSRRILQIEAPKDSAESPRISRRSNTTEKIEVFQTPRRSTRLLTQLSENEKTLQEDSKALIVANESVNHLSLNSGFQTFRRSTRLAVTQLSEKSVVEDHSGDSKALNFIEGPSEREDEEESHDDVRGWTEEQESALQIAYLTEKPSPKFWKKVSRQVPGKSARECFDKVNSDYATTPQRRRVSKSTQETEQNLISASEVLKLTNKPKQRRKTPIHIARRKARHLLQEKNHNQVSTEADLFSVLEPNLNFEVSTPKQKGSLKKKLAEISSSSSSSPFDSSSDSMLSPPVLKMVKDKALHEKYIDRLHIREARRKTAYRKAKKFSTDDDDGDRMSCDPVRAAKNALASKARDAVEAIRQVRDDGARDDNSSDFECDFRDDESEIEI